MNIVCKHCRGSGKYVGYLVAGPGLIDCKYCRGTGYIEDDELITVPRKYIMDEYFKDMIL